MENILIFDKSLRLTGVCDTYSDFRWEEKFAASGTFWVSVPLTWADRFPVGSFVTLPGTQDGFFVQSVREDCAAGVARITGESVLALFSRKVIADEITQSGAAEEILCDLAAEYGAETLPCTLSTVRYGFTEEVHAAVGHTSLLSALEAICTESGLGMRLSMDALGGGFVFSVRRRQENARFLSRSVGNLRGAVRVCDFSPYKNRAIVCGNGDNIVTVHAAGLFGDGVDDQAQDTAEIWCDATDLAMGRYDSEAEYRAALAARGKRILAEHRPRLSLSVQTDEETAAALRPGDVCAVADAQLNLSAQALCTAKIGTFADGALHRQATLTVIG